MIRFFDKISKEWKVKNMIYEWLRERTFFELPLQ